MRAFSQWAPALVVVGALLSCGARLDPAAGGAPQPVESVLPASEAQVLSAVHHLFNDGLQQAVHNKFPSSDLLHAFALYPRKAPEGYGTVTLPDDFTLRHDNPGDPIMERYLQLPAAQRQADLYLYHALDRYWPSEVTVDGKPVDFTCDFIIHLAAQGETRTLVEVLEVRPRVRVGKKLAWSAHGVGFGKVDDIRLVLPTLRDRQRILRRIAAAVLEAQNHRPPS